MADKITKSWITNISKAQLEIYLREFNIEPHTLSKDIRKQRPSDHEERAFEQITHRFQSVEETAKDYARELRKIMRFTRLNEKKKLEWTYRNR